MSTRARPLLLFLVAALVVAVGTAAVGAFVVSRTVEKQIMVILRQLRPDSLHVSGLRSEGIGRLAADSVHIVLGRDELAASQVHIEYRVWFYGSYP